jgi:hypothetical protein
MVASAIETRLMGLYVASEAGRLKMPTPMMLPTISAIALVGPNRCDCSPVAGALARPEIPPGRSALSVIVLPPCPARRLCPRMTPPCSPV